MANTMCIDPRRSLTAALTLGGLAFTLLAFASGETQAQVQKQEAQRIEEQREEEAIDHAIEQHRRSETHPPGMGVPDPGIQQAPGRAAPDAEGQTHSPQPTTADLAGITAMRERMGADAPAGRGVAITQVEGSPGRYLPATGARWVGRTAIVARGGSSEPFGHAAAVGKTIYGQGGIAPSIDVVHAYPVETWVTEVLRLGRATPPRPSPGRIENHSWIGENPAGSRILRRLDWMIDRKGVTVVVGVNNGDTTVPQLLGSSHNAIAVGRRSGDNSRGYTRHEGEGRCKPDLVSAGGKTSFTTGVVTGLAACLLEQADKLPPAQREDATRPEVIKAALLAGAVRTQAWEPEPGRPLDPQLGAGEAHALRSILPIVGGRATPGDLTRRAGWAFEEAGDGETQRYTITTTQPLGPIGIALTWHRRIDGRVVSAPQGNRRVWQPEPKTTDFDLRLLRIDGEERELVAASASPIDNVELVHVDKLPPGRYAVEVEHLGRDGGSPWSYGLAYLFDQNDP